MSLAFRFLRSQAVQFSTHAIFHQRPLLNSAHVVQYAPSLLRNERLISSSQKVRSYFFQTLDKIDRDFATQPALQINPFETNYLTIADHIILYTRQILPFSDNNSLRFDKYTENMDENSYKELHKVINARVLMCRKALRESPNDALETLKQYRTGNCKELAQIGKIFARTCFLQATIETFSIKRGDHAFLVIGRQAGSQVSDFKSWGKDCVVCDPWMGTSFLASEIPTRLMDCRGTSYENGRSIPLLAPFNPKMQELQICLL